MLLTNQIDKTVINFYIFEINLSKVPLVNTLDKLFLLLSSYFFIVYYSFLINDEMIIEELNKSLTFQIMSKIMKYNGNTSLKKFLFFITYPIIYVFDSLITKNFAIYFTPILFFPIIITFFISVRMEDDSNCCAFFIALTSVFSYLLWVTLLIKRANKKKKNLFYAKYSENKKQILNRKKIN